MTVMRIHPAARNLGLSKKYDTSTIRLTIEHERSGQERQRLDDRQVFADDGFDEQCAKARQAEG